MSTCAYLQYGPLCNSAVCANNNSMFTLALLVGMTVLETTHGTVVANLGFNDVKFPKPVFCGDTLWAETEVVDRKESAKRPTQGIVTLRHSMFNQGGDLVCSCLRTALVWKKEGQSN